VIVTVGAFLSSIASPVRAEILSRRTTTVAYFVSRPRTGESAVDAASERD
jgi:hypothetical protein